MVPIENTTPRNNYNIDSGDCSVTSVFGTTQIRRVRPPCPGQHTRPKRSSSQEPRRHPAIASLIPLCLCSVTRLEPPAYRDVPNQTAKRRAGTRGCWGSQFASFFFFAPSTSFFFFAPSTSFRIRSATSPPTRDCRLSVVASSRSSRNC
jgi:hypothetical protein